MIDKQTISSLLQIMSLQKMKFIIPNTNVKVFGKAIHCLAKIGDEVFLEQEEDSFMLRTVNISK